MAAKSEDDILREAAKARGFRLVKSRRRKAGGDFGRYGLVDLKTGRECMGFGPDGLTGTPEEVHAYLRGGEVASWKRSLIGVVGSESGRPEPSARPERSRRASAPKLGRDTNSGAESPARTTRERPSTSLRTSGEGGVSPKVEALNIREATRRDAAALAKLLALPPSALAERLAASIKSGEPPIVAERDKLVGIAAWTLLATLQHGVVGRITLLFVVEDERRQGTGTALLAESERRLEEAGITRIEMALDIDFDAPTGFLRRTGWRRTTNGYGKELGT